MSSKKLKGRCRRVTNTGEPCKGKVRFGEFCVTHTVISRNRWLNFLNLAAAIIALLTFGWSVHRTFFPKPTPSPISRCTAIPAPDGEFFSISDRFDPSGSMGDIDDVKVEKLPDMTRLLYTPTGAGAHEWDYTYERGEVNERPARFGGVMFLSSPNNWGQQPGFDLRKFHRALKFDVQSAGDVGNVLVTIALGGVNWEWDHTKRQKNYDVVCPDSMPRFQRTYLAEKDWKSITWELNSDSYPEDYFRSVVGGFACLIPWDSNGGILKDKNGKPRTIVIEIRNIRYEK